jgi:predicted transcriptional regulator
LLSKSIWVLEVELAYNMWMNSKFSKIQIKIIETLFDEKGHSEQEIAEILNKKESNLNKLLKMLEKIGVIYRGEPRIPRGAPTAHRETPYYLWRDPIILRELIKHETNREKPVHIHVSRGPFILTYLCGSEYLESILREYGQHEIIEILRDSAHFERDEARLFLEYHDRNYAEKLEEIDRNHLAGQDRTA